MKKALFLYAHPNPHSSRANKRISESVISLPNVTFHSLYDRYPEFYIDVEAEHRLLLEHDLIVLQHPFYWYSMPPLLKLWFDLVLEYNFAYGPGGKALLGKDFLLSITAGGPESSYAAGGENHFPIESFFPPYEQTARLCGMRWHNPLVLFHSTRVSDPALFAHAEKVRDQVSAICAVKP